MRLVPSPMVNMVDLWSCPDFDFALLEWDATDDYESYLRFSRTDGNKLFAEGFTPSPKKEKTITGDGQVRFEYCQYQE